MALITKRLISDAVLFRLQGGDVNSAASVEKQDVWKATEQLVNSMFRMSQFNQTLPSGETIPDGVMIATYEDVPVVTYGDFSKATLPVIPISLPKNLGIYNISPSLSLTGVQFRSNFIPLARGQKDLLRTDKLLSDLMGQVAYEPRNNDVVFNKNLLLLGISLVDFELLVFDVSLYSETDILPIPSSMEDSIIDTLVQKFSQVIPENAKVNLLTPVDQK